MMRQKEYAEQVKTLADNCVSFGKIDVDLYAKYDVQRGLRDKNGNGVLAGLTKVSRSNPFRWWTDRSSPVTADFLPRVQHSGSDQRCCEG